MRQRVQEFNLGHIGGRHVLIHCATCTPLIFSIVVKTKKENLSKQSKCEHPYGLLLPVGSRFESCGWTSGLDLLVNRWMWDPLLKYCTGVNECPTMIVSQYLDKVCVSTVNYQLIR